MQHSRNHYPHLVSIGLSYIAAILLFSFLGPDFFEGLIKPFGLIGVFVAGALYTYSFTASIGALILISIAGDYAPGTIAVIGGIGSLMSDVAIFTFIRNDFKKEIAQITRTPAMRVLSGMLIFKARWFRDAVGAAVLASPLPDEIGIAIMASTRIEQGVFTMLAFIADMIGIYLLVSAASAVL